MHENIEAEVSQPVNIPSVRNVPHQTESQHGTLLTSGAVSPGSTMREFINEIEDFAPTIPDAVTIHYMQKSGVATADPRLIRLFSLATQKYISDIIMDAMLEARMKGMGQTKKNSKETRFTLTSDLLENVLLEYGIEVTMCSKGLVGLGLNMAQLAHRFCDSPRGVHVLDPLVDLRYRFKDMSRLARMLKYRLISADVDEIEEKYSHWWELYQAYNVKKIEKKELLKNCDGLLLALSLPNDLHDGSLEVNHIQAEKTNLAYSSECNMDFPECSVQCNPELAAQLMNSLRTKLIRKLEGLATLVVTPYMTRGAILEGINVPKENFPHFTVGADATNSFYLTGCGLPSLLSIFVKKIVSGEANKWPLRLFTSGTSYKHDGICKCSSSQLIHGGESQHLVVSLISFCRSFDEELCEISYINSVFQDVFHEILPFSNLSIRQVVPEKLHFYESSASSFIADHYMPVLRTSFSGPYISSRLNLTYDLRKSSNNHLIRIVYAEVDLTRIVFSLMQNFVNDPCDLRVE